MNYVKEIIKRGLIGILIGVFLSYLALIIITINHGTITIEPNALIRQFIIAGLLGFYMASSSVIYDVEHWSLLRQTITHFLSQSIYIPIAYIAGWMPRNAKGIIIYIVLYIMFYVIQWIIFYTYWKRKAIKLNEELLKYKDMKGSV